MKMATDWFVWGREPLRYVLARRVYSNWAGSGYEYCRRKGKVLRFWTHAGAQDYVNTLNENAECPPTPSTKTCA